MQNMQGKIMEQEIITPTDDYRKLDEWLEKTAPEKIMLVCGKSISYHKKFCKHLQKIEKEGIGIVPFQNFQPNPLYENVLDGVELFRNEKCNCIIAVGGGSAIDVAKCIKLFSGMDGNGRDGSFLNCKIIPNSVPFLVMPTTAGTGSESTRYAVIYYEGKKQSVTSENCIPDAVLMDSDSIKDLPLYHKKAAMMDAFCHSIESFWSINSTEESKSYSRNAIHLILEKMDEYLEENTANSREKMLLAANLAGKAINITQTTAGHAMCYKITSLFGCAHGHAAILCDRVLFPHMIRNMDLCIDVRGSEYLNNMLQELSLIIGCNTPEEASKKINDIFSKLDLRIPSASNEQYRELMTSVNPVRLKNHPILLNEKMIDDLYHHILMPQS